MCSKSFGDASRSQGRGESAWRHESDLIPPGSQSHPNGMGSEAGPELVNAERKPHWPRCRRFNPGFGLGPQGSRGDRGLTGLTRAEPPPPARRFRQRRQSQQWIQLAGSKRIRAARGAIGNRTGERGSRSVSGVQHGFRIVTGMRIETALHEARRARPRARITTGIARISGFHGRRLYPARSP